MKNMKRFLSFIIASVMVLAMSLPVFAGQNTDVTINGEGKVFVGYRLFDATQSANGSSTAYTLNPDYAQVLGQALGVTGEKEMLDKLAAMSPAETRTFANDIAARIIRAGISADITTPENTKKMSGPAGYYLIIELQKKDDILEEDPNSPNYGQPKWGTVQDDYSAYMLSTLVGDETINTKESSETVVKKVKEVNDTTGNSAWQDAADHDVGDEIEYYIEGTVNKNFKDFVKYEYAFHDHMSEGLSLIRNSVQVYAVHTDGTRDNITSSFNITTGNSNQYTNGTLLTVSSGDLKTVSVVQATDVIRVEYKCRLNEDAKRGVAGNPNKVQLIYTNKPDGSDKGKTPYDVVTVFTFDIVVNKVNEEGVALDGAGFTLYKEVPQGTTGAITLAGHAGKYYKEVATLSTGSKFEFKGEDSGKYLLVETTVPNGYNKADDVEITVTATYDTDANDPKLTNVTVDPSNFTINQTYETITGSIENRPGLELPETGGIGTTIFYVLGAVLMIGAGVVLVTRRRLSR